MQLMDVQMLIQAREQDFQKSLYRKKESFDLVFHFFLRKSRCSLKKKRSSLGFRL